MVTGLDGQMQQGLALGGADDRIRKDQGVAVDHHSVVCPQVEMAEEKLGINRQQKLANLMPALFLDPHVKIAGNVQRLELIPPGEAKMIVAPAAADGEVYLVLPGAFKRPAILFDGMLEHVERVFEGLGWGMGGKLH